MRRVLFALALVLAVPVAIAGRQQPVFRSGVDLVRVDVSVMNGATAVPGLTIENFALTDNGVSQKLDSVSLDKVPLNLMLVLDLSGSMAGERMMGLIDAATALVAALGTDDRAALMRFSEPIRLNVAATTDRPRVLTAIKQLQLGGATSLNDAVFFGLHLRPPDAADTRPVVLVFSDGRDTSSWLPDDQLLEATRRSGALVHVVELVENRYSGNRYSGQSDFLGDLASAGGGRRWRASSARDLRELFGRVLDELRSRYLLSYYPAGVASAGWHDVKVALRRARGDVTARPGYFVSP